MTRWLLYYLLTWLLAPVAWLLPPFVAPFARPLPGPINNNNGTGIEPRLSGVWSFMQTPDNSLLGDAGHKARWAGRSEYLQRVAWLWRNRLYGLRWNTLAAPVEVDAVFEIDGDLAIRNRKPGRAGFLRIRIGGYWQYKLIAQTGTTRCIQINFGWLLDPYVKALQHGRLIKGKAIFTSSIRFTDFFQ